MRHGTFGDDPFGRQAEKLARFFGTPKYILGQTVIVIFWIVLNSVAVIGHWDPYYAAPLILLAQTRQTDRDKLETDKVDARHTKIEEAAAKRTQAIKTETDRLAELLDANTQLTQQDKELTEQVAALTREIHALLTKNTG